MSATDRDARSKLLQVGTKLFAARGIDGTSTRELAHEAGVNISLISYYFDGKEGLYKTILQEYAMTIKHDVEAFLASAEVKISDKETFRSVISELLLKIMESHMQFPEVQMIFQREMFSGLKYSREIYESIFSQVGSALGALIERVQKKGIVRDTINPRLFVVMIVRLVEGVFMTSRCETSWTKDCVNLPHDHKMIHDQILKVLMEGVLVS